MITNWHTIIWWQYFNIHSLYLSSVLPSSVGQSASRARQQIYRDPSHHETHTGPMRSEVSSHTTRPLVQSRYLIE